MRADGQPGAMPARNPSRQAGEAAGGGRQGQGLRADLLDRRSRHAASPGPWRHRTAPGSRPWRLAGQQSEPVGRTTEGHAAMAVSSSSGGRSSSRESVRTGIQAGNNNAGCSGQIAAGGLEAGLKQPQTAPHSRPRLTLRAVCRYWVTLPPSSPATASACPTTSLAASCRQRPSQGSTASDIGVGHSTCQAAHRVGWQHRQEVEE